MKKRRTHHHLKQKLNSDQNPDHRRFLASLSSAEREFFDKFESEFVRGEFAKDDSLHPASARRDLYNAAADARYDLLNSHPDQVQRQQAKPTRPRANTRRYYSPRDYCTCPGTQTEDFLIEVIDLARASSKD